MAANEALSSPGNRVVRVNNVPHHLVEKRPGQLGVVTPCGVRRNKGNRH